MLDLRQERGLTYLFITHDLSLAWVIADRIAVMYLGKIMEIGPAEQVIREPRNPYTQALVSVSPSPEPPTDGDPRPAHDPASARRRTRRTSRPAAASTRAVRWRSIAAGSRSRRCSTSAMGSPRRAGWPSRVRSADRRTRPCRWPRPRRGAAGVDRQRADADPARSTRAIAGLLAATPTTVDAEIDALGDGRRLAAGARGVERQRMRRPPHRGRAARVRRPDPDHPARADHPDLPPDLEDWDPPAVAEARARPPRDRPRARGGVRRPCARTGSRSSGRSARTTSGGSGATRRSATCASTSCSASGCTTTATTSASCSAVTQARVWAQMGNARRFSLEEA